MKDGCKLWDTVEFKGQEFYADDQVEQDDYNSTNNEIPRVENGKLIVPNKDWSRV